MSPQTHCAPTELRNLKHLVSINISSLRDVPTKKEDVRPLLDTGRTETPRKTLHDPSRFNGW